jgi:hypothetical protein
MDSTRPLSQLSGLTPDQSVSQVSFDIASTDPQTTPGTPSEIGNNFFAPRSSLDCNVKGKIFFVKEGDQVLLDYANNYLRVIHLIFTLIIGSKGYVSLVI